ncbi:hypothetical protein CCR85_00255 [Rhodothalassium salexigens]|uniref:CCA tRNA nucleotidyltransferase n=1 Tax=Rhodothalassium salexigens TaxID=1086 RepID=UPI001A915E0C|nr:CCA tRNA nucleotidyltransferase [Rhodothalassium salexigens]MBK5909925.1 hypothetical protein [Rhodothalassium salexigens]
MSTGAGEGADHRVQDAAAGGDDGLTDAVVPAAWPGQPPAATVLTALGAGAARYVGGAVRDALLGRPVQDIDIATVHGPETVIERVRAAGLAAHPTGLDHGTVTVVAEGHGFEVTTLRHDLATDGRYATVAFTDDWRADAARRDFTMNALYADAGGRIYDYTGGIADARSGRVRFIGDAAARIEEDGLRILRFFRFHAWYGAGAPDPAAVAACAAHRGLLGRLSAERVGAEIVRLLGAPDPGPSVAAMARAGVLAAVLPVAAPGAAAARLARLVARERQAGVAVAAERRLAALVGPEGADGATPAAEKRARSLGRSLRLSKAATARLEAALGAPPDLADRPGTADARTLAEAVYWDGRAAVVDRLLLDARLDDARSAAAVTAVGALACPRFPLGGRDLLALGLTPGPGVGRLLKRLERDWVAAGFAPDRERLLDRAAALIAGTGDASTPGDG